MLFATSMSDTIPIKGLVFFLALYENFSEHLAKEIVVRLFLELESLHVLEVSVKNEAVFSIRLNEVVYLRHLL